MITIKDFLKIINYRITEGSEFCWQCFGPHAYGLDSWDGDNINGYSLNIIFDKCTQVVYQVDAHDFKRERAYRYTNPEFRDAHNSEEKSRGAVDYEYNMHDLEVLDDWIEKATAIANYKDYDNRIQVPITLPDDEMFKLMKMAHERDITLNQMVEEVLKATIEQIDFKE